MKVNGSYIFANTNVADVAAVKIRSGEDNSKRAVLIALLLPILPPCCNNWILLSMDKVVVLLQPNLYTCEVSCCTCDLETS